MPSRSSAQRSGRSKDAHALLDPYGIYGTRTANRMRAARRRRQTQNFVLVLLFIGVLFSAFTLARQRRVSAVKPASRLELLTPITTAPLWVNDERAVNPALKEAVLLATPDGRLLRSRTMFNSDYSPAIVLDTAFPLHTPQVVGDIAYVPCEDGVLYAVNWQTKEVLWRYNFHAPLSTRPALSQISIVGVATKPVSTPAPPDVTAPTVTPTPTPVPQTSTTRSLVIAGADDGLIAAVDAKTGNPLWRTRLPAPPGDAVAVSSDSKPKVLVPIVGSTAMRGGVWCLDATTGKVLWRFPKTGREEAMQIAAPVLDEAANRVFCGNDLGALTCLDLRSGTYNPQKRIGWKKFAPHPDKTSEPIAAFRAAPLLFFSGEPGKPSTRLVAGASDGGVRCFASRTGDVLWSFDAGAPIAGLQKTQGDGRDSILVTTRGDMIFLLDAKTGATLQSFAARNSIAGATFAGDAVLAVTTEGTLLRFPFSF